ncbi:tetratricopeptide repeat protein, partial [Candidatus Fermentibacterales bacterium]|nr:tetratricopeptide repeat protein [Candidatus Fermentibacterales bacterium]
MELEGIVSRRHLSGGRTDVVFISGGERRIGRVFRYEGDPEVVREMVRKLSGLDVPGVVLPTEVREAGNRLLCLSASGVGVTPYTGPPMSFGALIEPILRLHSSGLLHLGIGPQSYVTRSGKPHLLFWGDSLLTHADPDLMPAEVTSGGFATPAADFHMLGRAMLSSRGYLWDDPEAPEISLLMDSRPSRRLNAVSDRTDLPAPASLPREARWLPKPGFTLVSGGSWQQRDSLVNEWVSTAAGRGWGVRVVRCRPQESMRSLPDRPAGGGAVDSPATLVRTLFPAASGVERLVVFDQVDYASEDLLDILCDFMGASPPDMAVVLTQARSPVFPDRASIAEEVRLPGEATAAIDLDIFDVGDIAETGGYPGPAWFGVRFRAEAQAVTQPSPLGLTLQQLHDEGSYRAACQSAGESTETLSDSERTIVAACCVRLGRFADAEALAPDSAPLVRGRALLGMGRNREAEALLRDSLGSDGDASRSDKALLLARCLVEQSRFDEASLLLRELDDLRAIPLLARILDMQGRPSEALPLLREALDSALESDRVALLSSLANVSMRLGSYGAALEAADEAVEISRRQADPLALRMSLQERGRVREVLGRWPEALEDYGLASFYASESLERSSRPPHVDLYVLQLAMGELQSAFRTFDELSNMLTLEGSGGALQLLSMLTAYTGV